MTSNDNVYAVTLRKFVGGSLLPMTCGTALTCELCGNEWVGVFSAFVDERELPCPRCNHREDAA